MRLVRVVIIYKNGAKVRLRCKSFTVEKSNLDGSVTRLAWDDARPRPLMAGIDEVAAVFSRKWTLLHVIAVLLAVCISLTFAASALAAESTVDVCRHADGTPAPTEGWAHVVADDAATGNIAANSCAQGGHIDATLGAGAHRANSSVLFTGTLPPGAVWTKLQAWMVYRATPAASADDPTHRVSLMVAGTSPCSWGRGSGGCSMFGSFDGPPLSVVNRYTVTPSSAGQPLSIGVLCDSSPGQCPATAGDPYATVRVYRMAVTIVTPDPPTPGTHDPGSPAPEYPAPLGSSMVPVGKLTARLRPRGARRVVLSGRLVGADGKPVVRARLVLRRQTRGRRATFSRLVTRRDGRFVRVLGRGSRPASVVVRWKGVTSRTMRIGARR